MTDFNSVALLDMFGFEASFDDTQNHLGHSSVAGT